MSLYEIFQQGIEEIIPESAVELIKNAKKHLTIKFGADPSAPDLHVGHVVVLNKLRLLQDMGHSVIFIIGDFTAMIGDPTGKSKTRPSLTKEQVAENAQSYQEQVFKVLDRKKTKVVFNSEWLDKLSAADMIGLAAKYNVARMLERDDFNKRYKSNQSISIHEFLYPLLQGYDSVVLENDIEIGGTDQKFNLLVGRHLQKEFGKKEQAIITVPILEGLDGVQKMSKSLNNHIGINDSPKEIYGKAMSIPDALIIRYFKLATRLGSHIISGFETQLKDGENPRNIKDTLARTLVEMFYTKEDAVAQSDAFENVFSKGENPKDMPDLKVEAGCLLGDAVIAAGALPSKKEFRRLVDQGAVTLDGEKISDPYFKAPAPSNQVLKIGKRKFFKLV
ncbi:tyrosine--tRNA ligase [Candidatus Marinamargulisbacteria bacterium SCGC AAA071-K20]|nr:tyrosine--tRNA ligase [Candidatus Marinamargulisbacteria bacterium SCGC AAA071-K20]